MSAIAEIREDRGPNFIMREFVQRRIVVQCNVAGRDLISTVSEIQGRVANQVTLPQGYHIEYGGQFQAESEATRLLLILGSLSIAAIVFLLATVFRSLTHSDSAESSLGACRWRGWRFHWRRNPLRSLHHRVHYALRDRYAQRHHV